MFNLLQLIKSFSHVNGILQNLLQQTGSVCNVLRHLGEHTEELGLPRNQTNHAARGSSMDCSRQKDLLPDPGNAQLSHEGARASNLFAQFAYSHYQIRGTKRFRHVVVRPDFEGELAIRPSGSRCSTIIGICFKDSFFLIHRESSKPTVPGSVKSNKNRIG